MLSLNDYLTAVLDFWFAHNDLNELMEVFMDVNDEPQVVEEEFYVSYVDENGVLSLELLMRLVADHYRTPQRVHDFLEQYEMVLNAEPIVEVDEGYFSEEEEEDD